MTKRQGRPPINEHRRITITRSVAKETIEGLIKLSERYDESQGRVIDRLVEEKRGKPDG